MNINLSQAQDSSAVNLPNRVIDTLFCGLRDIHIVSYIKNGRKDWENETAVFFVVFAVFVWCALTGRLLVVSALHTTRTDKGTMRKNVKWK